MDLGSCDNCGVVVDLNKRSLPDECRKYKEDGSVDESKFTYIGGQFVPYIPCLVCNEPLTREE